MNSLGAKLVGIGVLVLVGFGLIYNTTYMISAGHAGKEVSSFFDQDGIIIEQASLGKVEPDSATKEAIQAVANAQYKQRQAEYEKIAAEAEAKKKVAVAEAYYNAQVASSLTPEMVQLKQVEKWDGKLPTYSGITNGMFSFK